MSRRLAALKPQLNRIRAWAHEGSTDAWIAHQLETTAEAVRAFRQEHGIERGGPAPPAPITPDSVVEAMLAEEAAALEAGPEPEAEREPEPESTPARPARRRTRQRTVDDAVEGPEVVTAHAEAPPGDEPTPSPEATSDEPAKSSRRRGARSGSGRSAATAASQPAARVEPQAEEPADEAEGAEAPLDEEPGRSGRKRGRRRGRGRGGSRGLEARLLPGSVLLLDPAVTADAVFLEHWQDAGQLRVEVSTDAIVLRRIAADAEPERSDRSQGS
jgi:hypothetical protein